MVVLLVSSSVGAGVVAGGPATGGAQTTSAGIGSPAGTAPSAPVEPTTVHGVNSTDESVATSSATTDVATAANTDTGVGDASIVTVPDGFRAEVWASSEEFSELGGYLSTARPGPNPGVRLMKFRQGTMYVSVPDARDGEDRLLALPDDDGDGDPDRVEEVVPSSELNDAHGFDFHDGHLYVVNYELLFGDTFTGGDNEIVRYDMNPDGLTADTSTKEVLNTNVPDRGGYFHWTRTIVVRDDGMYVSVGSESNAGPPSTNSTWYAAITRCDLDGTNCTVYADGLRNAVGIQFHDGKLFATDNGRDDLENPELPPDEINVVEQGKNYGWPYCYGNNTLDTDMYSDPSLCDGKEPAAVHLRAHTVPLGFAFYTADAFPAEYQGDMYVAQHGSFDVDDPRGYKLSRVPYDGTLGQPVDFATGWYDGDGDSDPYEKGDDIRGRPVDVTVGPDGDLYMTDDTFGRIYRIWYTEPTAAFDVTPSDPVVSESVQFDASASFDRRGSITAYRWDFDNDGTVDQTTTDPVVNATFDAAGERTVALTVVDDAEGGSETNTTTRTVTVSEPPEPPTASFVVETENVVVGDTVTFNASGSSDPDGTIIEYRWDFDNDSSVDRTTTDPVTTTTFDSYGDREVTLVVVDDDDLDDATTRPVDVAPAPICESCSPP